MIRFDFLDYPKFYTDFRIRMERAGFYVATTSAESCTQFMRYEFGYTVEICPYDKLWVVSMDEKEFTMFLLKWA